MWISEGIARRAVLIVVIGGSGSGKSAYAEKKTEELFPEVSEKSALQKYYLATMMVYDKEMQRKVLRHQQRRTGRGWVTLEYPTDVGKAAEAISGGTGGKPADRNSEISDSSGAVVLLEDLGNLVANEMFRESGTAPVPADVVCDKVSRDILQLEEAARAVVVVSNQVFCDGIDYDPGTMEYIRALGELHQALAARAAEVTEVVVGIPVRVK